jgi:ankyrin repeat protein
VKLLLKKGAELETKSRFDRRTPLSWAAGNGQEAVVKLLLEKGAELETKSRGFLFELTPLLYAAESRHEAVVRLLLDNGAQLEIKSSLARGLGYEEAVKLLMETGGKLETYYPYEPVVKLSWRPRMRKHGRTSLP